MYLGDFTTSNTVYIYFNSFDSNDPTASVTLTGLALADIKIYKNGSVTQRSSTAGIALLDTDGTDFDAITGINGFSIDLSDNTDSGFYAAGSEYTVIVNSVTIDGGVVNFVAGSFSIERSGGALALLKDSSYGLDQLVRSTTPANTLDIEAGGCAGIDWGNIANKTTANDLSGTDIQLADTVTSVTNAVTLPTIPSNWITAAGIAASALDGKGDWNIGKTGYSLTQSFPTNFSDLSITATTGRVTVGTNNDKTGYSVSGTITTLDGLNNFDPANDTVATVTTLTNLPAITSNWLTAAGLATDAVNEIRDAIMPTQNAVFNNIMFLFVADSDGVTPVTGATGTAVTRSIDGGAFGSGTGTLTEVGNGIYQYDASAADMNGGIITFRFTGTGGIPGAPNDAFVTVVTGGGV